jgi:hypothetical protein
MVRLQSLINSRQQLLYTLYKTYYRVVVRLCVCVCVLTQVLPPCTSTRRFRPRTPHGYIGSTYVDFVLLVLGGNVSKIRSVTTCYRAGGEYSGFAYVAKHPTYVLHPCILTVHSFLRPGRHRLRLSLINDIRPNTNDLAKSPLKGSIRGA